MSRGTLRTVKPGFVVAQVAAVQVTAFINNTYHSLVHYEGRGPGVPGAAVDARPSDAINLALRFGAPVYVAKKVCALSPTSEALTYLHMFPN